MEPFTKIVILGTTLISGINRKVFCRIEWDGKNLSIQGTEGPRKGGNWYGVSGQIVMDPPPEWSQKKIAKFWEVCPDCGHSLGSKCLYMEVPEEVLEWLNGLPETDIVASWV